jgi:hypothetical protein
LTGEAFDAKADFIASLDDAQFKTFSESLASVAHNSKQAASYSGNGIPDPITSGNGEINFSELAKALRETNKR